MSSWFKRKTRMVALLNSQGDEEADGLALDRLLHGQSVIGKTSKTTEIDALRFTNRDLNVVGTLEYGQFGVIDVVTCNLDGRVYVRKSTEKRFAMKNREQCSPQLERDILLQATKTDSHWAPKLFCAFQSPTHLNLIMTYAEGGTLWDVLESSPHDGKVSESDLQWWAPQIVSAIHWCHLQGFSHRDIKPHNFVLTPTAHVLLIDFGSAASLLPSRPDGSQQIAKQHCMVPCGTCDYISPEILQAHEEALVALEMTDDDENKNGYGDEETGGYGRETDWWSLGAMLYEMAYGVAPFFAKDIRQTYLRIMNHETSLRFPRSIPISAMCEDLLRRLLANREERLGRQNVAEIMDHLFFQDINWHDLHDKLAPSGLHLPQFTYSTPRASADDLAQSQHASSCDQSHSRPFAFSTLFQSSRDSSPGLSALHSTPSQRFNRSALREQAVASFIGFSWGPRKDIFPALDSDHKHSPTVDTPRPLGQRSSQSTPYIKPFHPASPYPFVTPMRPTSHTISGASTLRRRSTAQRRTVSDREAMKQLVDCVGMSARKKVLESGRKPRILVLPLSRSASGGLKKDVRFGPPHPQHVIGASDHHGNSAEDSPSDAMAQDVVYPAGSDCTESEGPPSPSPSPRPGSAMSMLSRRSVTSSISASYSQRRALGSSNTLSPHPLAVTFRGDKDFDSNVTEQLPDQTFTTGTLDALENKHVSIMGEIEDIERRLDCLLTQVTRIVARRLGIRVLCIPPSRRYQGVLDGSKIGLPLDLEFRLGPMGKGFIT